MPVAHGLQVQTLTAYAWLCAGLSAVAFLASPFIVVPRFQLGEPALADSATGTLQSMYMHAQALFAFP